MLPDLAQDRATGVRGLGHLLGPLVGGLLSFCLLALVGVTIAAGAIAASGLGGWPAALVIGGCILTIVIAAAGVLLAIHGSRSRWLMRLVMTAAIIDVIALVAAGPVISA